jgi:predicted ArsR family transcriptional regulator
MTDLADLPLFDTAKNWKKPGTSSDAAAAAAGKASYWRARVLEAIRHQPGTADEIAARLGADILSIRPRTTELFNRGLIETTGERRPTPRGRTADVWRVRS